MPSVTCENPRIAPFYVSVFPQLVSPSNRSVLRPSVVLGSTLIAVSFCVNLAVALCAAGSASWFARNPGWLALERYLMGFVLAALAARLAVQRNSST